MTVAVEPEVVARIGDAVLRLAVARGAGVLDDVTNDVYVRGLLDCRADLVERACEALGLTQRADYEPVMPPLPDIRAKVRELARQDTEATQRAKLLQLPARHDDEPRFFCTSCYDEPAGWQVVWCPGDGAMRQSTPAARALSTRIAPCGRRPPSGQDHAPHTYVERCPCVETNPVIAKHRERLREHQARKAAK